MNIIIKEQSEVEDDFIEFTLSEKGKSVDFIVTFDPLLCVFAQNPDKVREDFEDPKNPFPGVTFTSDFGYLRLSPSQVEYTSSPESSKAYYTINLGAVALIVYGPGAETPRIVTIQENSAGKVELSEWLAERIEETSGVGVFGYLLGIAKGGYSYSGSSSRVQKCMEILEKYELSRVVQVATAVASSTLRVDACPPEELVPLLEDLFPVFEGYEAAQITAMLLLLRSGAISEDYSIETFERRFRSVQRDILKSYADTREGETVVLGFALVELHMRWRRELTEKSTKV